MADIEKKIEGILEDIKDIAKFEYWYIQDLCFREKVNSLYKQFLTRKYQEREEEGFVKNYLKKTANSVESSDLRLVAPIAVHANYLDQARAALARCLRQNSAKLLQTNNDFNLASLNTSDFPDSATPLISPFDRRLDRLVIENNSVHGIIPISTAYAQSGTIGYTVSSSFIRNSNVGDKEKYIAKIKGDIQQLQNDDFFIGVPALMNNYAHVKLYGSKGGRYLVNQRGERKWYEVDQAIGDNALLNLSLNPTTSSLISWGNGDPYGRTPYNFTDFVFCKHWNKVQNNRMITLRRYPAAILDNLKFPGMDGTQSDGSPGESEGKNGVADGGSAKKISFPPMASAVTYFGDETDNKLSDILKFTTGFEWEDQESNVWSVSPAGGESLDPELGPGGKLFPGFTKIAKTLNVATGNWNPDAVMNKGMLPPDPYQDGPYENRIIGPVNRITKVKKRKAGIKFEMSGIQLKFDYVARPIGGVNTKAVLLDIISNFLIIGSTSAVFWGGQHRFMGNPQKYPFLGGDKGMQQWYAGKPLEWGQTTIQEFLGKGTEGGGIFLESLKNIFKSIMGGGGGEDLYGSLKNTFSGAGVGGKLLKAFAAEKSNGQIPYLQGLKALLIGEPVGEWHVTIGNPLNPIAMIGNLICDSIEIEFGNELGPDDFPMEMRVTVKLDHGMARDRDAIQSIFNRGMGRIYDLPDSFRGTAEGETKVDNNSGNGPDIGRNPVYYKVPIANSGTVGGKFGTSKVVDNAMQGAVSIWNRSAFTSVSPNVDYTLQDKNSYSYPLFRSAYRAVDWVALKSLQ